MAYEWDAAKAERNLKKHGVDFADATAVLEDEAALLMVDPSTQQEERWISIGLDSLSRILVVIYTWRNGGIRLISARPATARERKQYEEQQ